MKNFVAILLLLLFGGLNSFAQNQQLKFNHITKDNGLASNKILYITQDKFGFIWFGTEDGLSRFDGTEFENFKNNPDDTLSLINNYVNCISEEPVNGNLWVATNKGLSYFDRNNYKFYHNFRLPANDSSLLNKSILSVLCDSKTGIWAGTAQGLYYFRNRTEIPEFFNTKKVLKKNANDSIRCIFEDSDKNIWIGNSSSLLKFNPSTKTFEKHPVSVSVI